MYNNESSCVILVLEIDDDDDVPLVDLPCYKVLMQRKRSELRDFLKIFHSDVRGVRSKETSQ
jgi:hypothetical protein